MPQLQYALLDVFTNTRFLGNPLAIVNVPKSASLSQQQKQLIAREFNLSETAFLHEPIDDSRSIFPVDIFTINEELPFAGHPTIGTGFYLLTRFPDKDTVTLRTKAGDIPVVRESGGVRLQVPQDYKEHAPFFDQKSKSSQVHLKPEDWTNGADAPEPVVSIVKGMTFLLLQVNSEEALGSLTTYSDMPTIPPEHLDGWARAGIEEVFIYAFVLKKDLVRARMFGRSSSEDPATGSAASTLGGWLGLKKGPGEWKFEIVQGVEMGRESTILVFVEISERGEIVKIELGGKAVQIMEGVLEA